MEYNAGESQTIPCAFLIIYPKQNKVERKYDGSLNQKRIIPY